MPTINGRACVANGTLVDKAFSNGMQVYARNILIDSDFIKSPSAWTQDGAMLDNSGTFAKLTSLGTSNSRIYSNGTVFDKIPFGSTYSISFVAYSDISGTTVSVGALSDLKSSLLNTVPTKYEVSGTKDASANYAFTISVPKVGAVVYIRKIKVNLGNLPTPWTPAPEDVM